MLLLMLKDFKWSYKGEIVPYKTGEVKEIPDQEAKSMIENEFAQKHEKKMHTLDQLDKMFRPDRENKDLGPRYREAEKQENKSRKKTKKTAVKQEK